MHNLHYISSDLKRQAENNLEVATNRAGEAKRKLEKAKKAFKEAEAERKAADVCLFGLNKVHKKVQKRLLSVTKDTVAGREFLLEAVSISLLDSLDEEPPAKQSKNDEENEKLHCKVCFYPFDDEHHEAVLTTCGHKACFNCLTTLRKNECPSCRKKFTKGKILKIFD